MPDIQIIKLKVRRGTNAQRKTVLLEQGELGYATDTKRLFVGDGVTLGGLPANTTVHLPRTSPGGRIYTNAERNDLVYDTSMLFQLTGTDSTQLSAWARVGTVPDDSSLEYNGSNILQIKTNGIQGDKFHPNAVSPQGGLAVNPVLGLSANVDGRFIAISGNNFITLSSFDSSLVRPTSLGNGLSGGDGTSMFVAASSNTFGFINGYLALTGVSNNIITVDALNNSFLGSGLEIAGGSVDVNPGDFVDDVTIEAPGGILQLKSLNTGGQVGTFNGATYNSFGQILTSYYTIVNTFTGFANAVTSSNLSSSIHNGYASQTTLAASFSSTIRPVRFSALSSTPNGTGRVTEIVLSSAGYIAFESTGSEYGTFIDRFAIPIFAY